MVRAPSMCKAFNYNNKPRPATVNNITAEEAEKASDVVLGTLLVNSIPAKVLFDTGASHSFVSTSFAQMHGFLLSSLGSDLVVLSPGARMQSSKSILQLQQRQVFSLEANPLPSIEDVPVVCDFPDVFPNELPGMPPDRAVEFVIELEPGTAPISKRPYKMGPNELAELKKQLDELEKLGFIQI
ncbi:uncharacterized protein [Lolium perenne]|uniref:uncharacterized protein n=1 Tax=Lolium perenne TaxID=4522 RepID=UPI003A9A2783